MTRSEIAEIAEIADFVGTFMVAFGVTFGLCAWAHWAVLHDAALRAAYL